MLPPNRYPRFDFIEVGPLTILRCSEQVFVDKLKAIVEGGEGRVITYSHLHTLALALKHTRIALSIKACDLCYCDGIGVSIISLLVNGVWIPKVTANSFIHEFARTLGGLSKKMALIGGAGDTLQAVSNYFATEGATIVCAHHGYLNDASRETLRTSLIDTKPDVVIIGMEQGSQEELALLLRKDLPSATFLCVGALFEFLSGRIWLCPPLVRQAGLEWVVRLVRDPGRLWRRYLLEGPALLFRATILRRL